MGTVRFKGRTHFREGEWVGVELDAARGKNDGSVHGTRYFECAPAHGLFTHAGNLSLLTAAPSLGGGAARPEVSPHPAFVAPDGWRAVWGAAATNGERGPIVAYVRRALPARQRCVRVKPSARRSVSSFASAICHVHLM
eukprot:4325138-Pleurochrysis_carterae.AAC.2